MYMYLHVCSYVYEDKTICVYPLNACVHEYKILQMHVCLYVLIHVYLSTNVYFHVCVYTIHEHICAHTWAAISNETATANLSLKTCLLFVTGFTKTVLMDTQQRHLPIFNG